MINGKALSQEIIKNVAKKAAKLKTKPGLAVILIGEDPASKIYIKLKQKACLQAGIEFHKYLFDDDCNQIDVLETINFLNNDDEVNAILIQLPLPKGYDTNKIVQSIAPKKDVDGFHKKNIKNFLANKPAVSSGLALGIMELIKSTEQTLVNKKAVIICNSKIFGKPLEKLFKDQKVTAKTILSSSKNIEKHTKKADIIVVAVGKQNFITADMIKKNSIIIDVGINKIKNKTVGDCDYDEIIKKTDYITPVPGGVGPMCVAMLLENTINCYKIQKN